MSVKIGLLLTTHQVVFPGVQSILTIRDQAGQLLIQYARETDEPVGVVWHQGERLSPVGCRVQIQRIIGHDEQGGLLVAVKGVERFILKEVQYERRYPLGVVEWWPDVPAEISTSRRERLITQHIKWLEQTQQPLRLHVYEQIPFVSYLIAANVGLSQQQRQEILELASEADRIEWLLAYLSQELLQLEQMREVRQQVKSNGHFSQNPPILGSSNPEK